MPKVSQRTKSNHGKNTYSCTGCRKVIVVGERFYIWCRRFGGKGRGTYFYRHTECGYPRPSELSSAKTAIIEDAIQDADDHIAEWNPPLGDHDFSALQSILQDVADQAKEVASSYEEGVSNMPESLQDGPVGQAMAEVAEELNDWADKLDSWEPEDEAPDEIEHEEHEDDSDFQRRTLDEHELWVDNLRAEAGEMLFDMPTYQG